jgi:hypothetical protein
MSPKIELLKPRDFGEIVNDTFIFIRQNFKPLLRYFFIFCGFFLLAAAATALMQQFKVINILNNRGSNEYGSYSGGYGRFGFFGWEYMLEIFFLWLENTAVTVTVLCYMTLYRQKGNLVPETEEMWGYFKFFFWKIMGSTFVLSILLVIASVLCLVPGIYLSPIFALVAPIMVMENATFGYAFNQSFKLIKENWWVTFGALIIIIIVLYVASLVVVMPAAIVNGIGLYTSLTKGKSISIVATIITTLLSQIAHVFYILPVVTAGLCYFNLNESKEGTGLIERINQFGNINPDTSAAPEEY